jgi:hypothetical protein
MDVSTISNNGFLGDTLLVKIAAWLWKVTEIFPSNVSLPNYLLFGKVREGGGGVHIDNNWVRKAIYLFFEFWKMNLSIGNRCERIDWWNDVVIFFTSKN